MRSNFIVLAALSISATNDIGEGLWEKLLLLLLLFQGNQTNEYK
jgi:hypothetical protein